MDNGTVVRLMQRLADWGGTLVEQNAKPVVLVALRDLGPGHQEIMLCVQDDTPADEVCNILDATQEAIARGDVLHQNIVVNDNGRQTGPRTNGNGISDN